MGQVLTESSSCSLNTAMTSFLAALPFPSVSFLSIFLIFSQELVKTTR